MNPDNLYKSITEICRIADIARDTYYEAFKDQSFLTVYNDVSKQIIQSAVMPTINAFKKQAARGSYQHGKVLLEMAGLYKENSKVELSGPDGKPVQSEVTINIKEVE
jgi:hypothetical protein